MTASSNDAPGSPTGNADDPEVVGAVLSVDPPIVYTSMGWPDRMGWISAYAASCGEGPAAFLIYQMWHLADDLAGKFVIANLRRYRRAHPRHELIMLCNAPDEVETLSSFGEEALLLNHNLTVSEAVFRPLPGVEIEFDAIYSARPVRDKRIELAAEIERVAYLCYVPVKLVGEGARVLAGMQARAPAHVILNRLEGGRPIRLRAGGVNQAYNRAAVGLCLSEVEGAMMSSIEYMLAGLPIVSTPSRGGRDFFFDPEYCLIVPPDPRAVREGVAALKARQIPRDHVRQKTLAKIEPQRRAFLALLDGFLERHGYAPRFGTEWPWLHHRSLCGTRTVSEQFAKARPEPTSRPLAEPA
ncbi:MAG TPA: glycosyltransferase [Bauldia sp.]|nr:glycosyltransferase [Bauldia sp.]